MRSYIITRLEEVATDIDLRIAVARTLADDESVEEMADAVACVADRHGLDPDDMARVVALCLKDMSA